MTQTFTTTNLPVLPKPIVIKQPELPMTLPQKHFLAGLLDTREMCPEVQMIRFAFDAGDLTKGAAGAFIDALIPMAKKTAPKPAEVTAPAAPVVPEYGYWNVAEKIYFFDKVKTPYGTAVTFRKLHVNVFSHKARWVKLGGTKSAVAVLSNPEAYRLTADQAGALGKQYGCCIRCGRTLTDPFSVARGIGPVCITYTGWAL